MNAVLSKAENSINETLDKWHTYTSGEKEIVGKQLYTVMLLVEKLREILKDRNEY